tara:strand:- start:12 stop:938 length:927 start_codon:yes stop_codon:yes gene_type:complete
MPKLTKTGTEIGSSEAGAIVLHKTSFQTRQEVLEKHKLARAGVEAIDEVRNQRALRRGTHLEAGVASWANEEIERLSGGDAIMFEPTEAFRREGLGVASSIDRIIELSEPLTLQKPDGDNVTFHGQGIVEIKTDFYHHDKPKPEWVIQVMHQMFCAEMSWAIIACMDQKGRLHLYPVQWDAKLVNVMVDAYAEFWELVQTDGNYPPIAENDKPEYVDITKVLKESNQDLQKLCADYHKAAGEERQWKKTKDEVKFAITLALDSLGVEYASIPGYQIKAATQTKEKKQSIGTGEFYEALSFTIKETSNE